MYPIDQFMEKLGLGEAEKLQSVPMELKSRLYPEFYDALGWRLTDEFSPCPVPTSEMIDRDRGLGLVMVLGSRENVTRYQHKFMTGLVDVVPRTVYLTSDPGGVEKRQGQIVLHYNQIGPTEEHPMLHPLRMKPDWIVCEPSAEPRLPGFVLEATAHGNDVCWGVESNVSAEQFLSAAFQWQESSASQTRKEISEDTRKDEEDKGKLLEKWVPLYVVFVGDDGSERALYSSNTLEG